MQNQVVGAANFLTERRRHRQPSRLEQVDLAVTASLGLIDRSDNAGQLGLNSWPTGCKQDNDGNATAREVLLVLQVFVSGDKDLKPGLLRRGDEITVLKLRPALFVRCDQIMFNQRRAQRRWSPLIKENPHSGSFESTSSCMLKHGARLLRGNAREPFDEIVQRCIVFKVFKER